MEKDIKDILDHRHYDELSEKEREALNDLCSGEEDYMHLKELFAGVDGIRSEKIQPSERTKRSLDDLFEKTYGSKKRVIWYNTTLTALYPKDKPLQRRPLVQVAAALILILLTVPLINKLRVTDEKALVASNTSKKELKETLPVAKDKTLIENGPSAEVQRSSELVAGSVAEEDKMPSMGEAGMVPSPTIDFSSSMVTDAAPSMAMDESVFDHPDGVFTGATAEVSRSARKQLKALDLLTPTF